MVKHIIPKPPNSLKIFNSVPGINPIYLLKSSNQELDLFLKSQKNIFWFGYGRNTVEYILRLLSLRSGTEILFPYYSCNVLLPLFFRYGLKVKFYQVNEQLQPDIEQMQANTSNHTRILLIVNYFGFPQDYSVIKNFCSNHNLIFLEDNAGGFGSSINGKLLGSFGDISFTCVRKTLPLTNGSYLEINNKSILEKTHLNELSLFKEKKELYRLAVLFYRWFLNKSNLLMKRREYINPQYYLSEDELRNYDYNLYKFSLLSNYLIRRLDLFRIKQHRRKQYKAWQDWLQQFPDIKPIFSKLPEGTNPQCYPVYTEKRNEWLKWGSQHGVDVCPWPSLSREQQSKETLALWKKTCCFPIS